MSRESIEQILNLPEAEKNISFVFCTHNNVDISNRESETVIMIDNQLFRIKTHLFSAVDYTRTIVMHHMVFNKEELLKLLNSN